jgi:hypothetical protein
MVWFSLGNELTGYLAYNGKPRSREFNILSMLPPVN